MVTSRLALGTAQFGLDYGVSNTRGQVPPQEIASILRLARTLAIETLDTAIAYGDAEQRLGASGVDGWRVISKLPPLPSDVECGPWVRARVRESLDRLQIRRLGGLLLHRPADLLDTRGAELYQYLRALRDDGVVEKVGISIYEPAELDHLLPKFTVDLVQAPFNLLDRRLAQSGWLERLAESGVEVHIRSLFLQGLLLMPGAHRPARFQRWSRLWQAWDAWLEREGISPLVACLAAGLQESRVARLVIGVESAAQLQEIVAAAQAAVATSVPSDFACADLDLINPSRWNSL